MGWRPSCQVRRRQLVTKLASYRPAAEQGAEVGQARSAGPTPHLCYLWPLCRLPSTKRPPPTCLPAAKVSRSE